jgi:putative hemolysin
LDSGNTALVIIFILSVIPFLGLHAADAALPLLRRANVRESLNERGIREAALRRLRVDRSAYEDLIWLLLPLASAIISASGLGWLIVSTELHWVPITGILIGIWLVLTIASPVIENIVQRLSIGALVTFGTIVQLLLWPLLPIRVFSRSGLRIAGADQEIEQGNNSNGVISPEASLDVEETIAEESLEIHERQMIRAILHLDQTPVREIMVPRVDVVSVDLSTPLDRAAARILDSGHSRLPVYEENSDNIVGILYSRDLLAATTNGAASPVLQDIIRPAFFVPESKRVDEMLTEFKERRIHMAVVVDEYGGVSGIVTVEDLLEEIVGEIEDEFDKDQPNILWSSDSDALIDARMSMDDFNESFQVNVLPDGFDTVGGLLLSRLGKIPVSGDVVTENDLHIRVVSTIGRRVKRVRVTKEVGQ